MCRNQKCVGITKFVGIENVCVCGISADKSFMHACIHAGEYVCMSVCVCVCVCIYVCMCVYIYIYI
jgi:hypothetical protein